MNAAGSVIAVQTAGQGGALHHTVTDRKAGRHPPVVWAGRSDIGTEGETQVVRDRGLEALWAISDFAGGHGNQLVLWGWLAGELA